MKKLITIICLLSLGNMFAQSLSKSEKKELLLEIKEMKKSPQKLKNLKESLEVRDVIIDQNSAEITELKNDIQKQELKINYLGDSLDYVNSKLIAAKQVNYNQVTTPTTADDMPGMNHQGSKYRVQIGVFKNYDITYLFDIAKYIVHEDANGLHRYSVGNFNSKSEAEAFKIEMQRLGISDAFVTTYNDGMRVDNLPNYAPNQPVKQQVVAKPTSTMSNGFNVKPSNYYNNVNTNTNTTTQPVQKQVVKPSAPTSVQINTQELNNSINSNSTYQPNNGSNSKEKVKELELQQYEEDPNESKSNGIKIKVGQ